MNVSELDKHLNTNALICFSNNINDQLVGMDEFRENVYNYGDLCHASVYDNFFLQ